MSWIHTKAKVKDKEKSKTKEGRSSVGKPGGAKGKGQNEVGPRQRAQQVKKQRFNKVLSDLACKKAFFMSFVRHPSYDSVDSIKELLTDLTEVMKSRDYKDMVDDSKKKTEEESEHKRKCHQARLAFKRGKREHENKVQSQLAKKYKTGELLEELEKAETAYTRGMWGSSKHVGIAALLKGPEKSYLYLLDD